jgi:hypothetical protein
MVSPEQPNPGPFLFGRDLPACQFAPTFPPGNQTIMDQSKALMKAIQGQDPCDVPGGEDQMERRRVDLGAANSSKESLPDKDLHDRHSRPNRMSLDLHARPGEIDVSSDDSDLLTKVDVNPKGSTNHLLVITPDHGISIENQNEGMSDETLPTSMSPDNRGTVERVPSGFAASSNDSLSISHHERAAKRRRQSTILPTGYQWLHIPVTIEAHQNLKLVAKSHSQTVSEYLNRLLFQIHPLCFEDLVSETNQSPNLK